MCSLLFSFHCFAVVIVVTAALVHAAIDAIIISIDILFALTIPAGNVNGNGFFKIVVVVFLIIVADVVFLFLFLFLFLLLMLLLLL